MMIAGKVQVVLLLPGDGGGLIGERERERARATCRRWWYLRGGDGVIYLGISEGPFLFFSG